jgi:hypothetical protein
VKISDCRVLTETAKNEVRICKGKSVGEQCRCLCVVVVVVVVVVVIVIIVFYS